MMVKWWGEKGLEEGVQIGGEDEMMNYEENG
jgi:hypothetical protein